MTLRSRDVIQFLGIVAAWTLFWFMLLGAYLVSGR
jgi:hypothetical protein